MKRLLLVLALCLALLVPATAQSAVFNMARDYIPAPPGTFATLLYYEHISSDRLKENDHVNFKDLGLNGNIGLFRPVYWLEAGPFIIDPQFIIPFGNLGINAGTNNPLDNGLAAVLNTSASGIGDGLWFATFWFVHNNDSKTYVGFTPIFISPNGTYRHNKLLNLGNNRWSFDEQLGIVQGVEVIPGHNAFFEIQFHGQFYTNNGDFSRLNAQASTSNATSNFPRINQIGANPNRYGTLSQAPEFDLEGHISYDITKAMWASVDYYGRWGADQKWESIDLKNPVANSTIGLTLAYGFAPGYQLALQYQADVATKSGTQNNIVLARFLWATDLKGLMGSK